MSYSSRDDKKALLDKMNSRDTYKSHHFDRNERDTLRNMERSGEIKSYVGDSGRTNYYKPR